MRAALVVALGLTLSGCVAGEGPRPGTAPPASLWRAFETRLLD